MSHHNHNHDHDHDHDHNHHYHDTEMTFEEKIVKLLEHWIKHNDDHAQTYRGWADQVTQNHLEAVGAIIEEAAEMNLEINKKFEQAKALIQDKG